MLLWKYLKQSYILKQEIKLTTLFLNFWLILDLLFLQFSGMFHYCKFNSYLFILRILFRLYWFLTKVLYSSAYVSMKVYSNGPFYLSFNIMLMTLYLLQVSEFVYEKSFIKIIGVLVYIYCETLDKADY